MPVIQISYPETHAQKKFGHICTAVASESSKDAAGPALVEALARRKIYVLIEIVLFSSFPT